MRRLDDEVYVKTVEAHDVGVAPQRPERFVWENRLYLVQEVLAQWRERRRWWRESEVGAEQRAPDSFVWRVQARAGACAPSGIYELVLEQGGTVGGAGDGSGADRWRLARVFD